MNKILAIAIAAGLTVGATGVASARDGCGPGFHRGPYGRCNPNRGGGAVIVRPGIVIGQFYPGRGYWDGRRYYQHRYRYHNDWRYR